VWPPPPPPRSSRQGTLALLPNQYEMDGWIQFQERAETSSPTLEELAKWRRTTT
jgi:hypothetical protein